MHTKFNIQIQSNPDFHSRNHVSYRQMDQQTDGQTDTVNQYSPLQIRWGGVGGWVGGGVGGGGVGGWGVGGVVKIQDTDQTLQALIY